MPALRRGVPAIGDALVVAHVLVPTGPRRGRQASRTRPKGDVRDLAAPGPSQLRGCRMAQTRPRLDVIRIGPYAPPCDSATGAQVTRKPDQLKADALASTMAVAGGSWTR